MWRRDREKSCSQGLIGGYTVIDREEIEKRLRRIRLIAIDLDGTLTDGSSFCTKDGDSFKRFYVRDRIGITLVQKAGFTTAIVSADASQLLERRAAAMNIHHVLMGCRAKAQTIQELADQQHLATEEIAYIGDDVNDQRAMKLVGLACCPNDAHPLILKTAHWVIPFPGGRGCVRALCDALLAAHGLPLNPEEPW